MSDSSLMFTAFDCPDFDGAREPPRLARWLVPVGAVLSAGDPLAEIEVDKLASVSESPADGTLRAVAVDAGATVVPGEPLALLGPPDVPLPDDWFGRPVRAADDGGSAPAPGIPGDAEIDLVEGPPRVLSGMRRVVARRMAASHRAAPCFYLTTSVDMSACEALRARLKAERRKATYNDMAVKAAALALRERPALLAAFSDGLLWPRESVNVGVALALDDGLAVPVVRDADRKPLDAVASEIRDFAILARKGKLLPAHCSRGVFTVSNLGMFDIDHFIAIVNPGESGILAIGRIESRPVVRAGEIVVRPMMNITLSGDHRVIDGAEGARFNAAVKRRLEKPESLLD